MRARSSVLVPNRFREPLEERLGPGHERELRQPARGPAGRRHRCGCMTAAAGGTRTFSYVIRLGPGPETSASRDRRSRVVGVNGLEMTTAERTDLADFLAQRSNRRVYLDEP